MSLIGRLIWLLASIVIGSLILQFIFMVLGANPTHWLVAFIYDFTAPFVWPFVGIFGQHEPLAGARQFEIATLVAIVIYGIVASILTRFFAPRG